MSLNRIDLQGRLTKDVDLRVTQSGTHVANFTVAVDRDFQSGGSERQTDFVECVAFKSTAEFVERNFHKGQLAVVSGRLQSRKWEDKNGNARVSWEVVADNVYFGGDKKQASPNVSAADFEDLGDDESGLPF